MKQSALIASVGAVALAASAVSAAQAQRPLPIRMMTPQHAVAFPRVPAPAHRYFGLLQGANGAALLLRLRDGRVLRINASEAFALKRVSQPLFPGKPTVVEGAFGAGGVFQATAVKRAAPHPAAWDADR